MVSVCRLSLILIVIVLGCGYSLTAKAASATGPQLTVSSNYFPFGKVTTGSKATLPVTLTSTGSTAVKINSASIGGSGFSVSGATFPVTLKPQQSVKLNLTFAPKSAGTVTGTLTVSSTSTTNPTAYINMAGTGVTPTTGALLSVSSTYLTFGNVAISSSGSIPVVLSSTGTSAVTISSGSIGGSGFSVSGASFPVTLQPKQTLTLNFKFAPASAGSVTGTMILSSNSATGSAAYINMSGTGVSASSAQLTVSPASLSFGDVAVGSSATLGVTLTSTGSSAVTINSATISGSGYTVSGATFPVTLSAKQTLTLQVKFAPTAASAATGKLTISSNSSSNATVAVSMSGTGTKSQVSLSWGAPSGSSDPVAGYHIYRATGSSASYSLLNSSIESQTSYMDSTVAAGTSYSYYVKSVDSSGHESAASNSINVAVP
ncbi:choice-of-anchor D domain-containing protein [Alloacidobacterium dinghuense]|uniref:Choice-of-anchor D domain-containing protein n=1 Tax=Alloacidobacterium dinghuense TaxID=2763107 RepID=A0A7G8BLQ0_9BACT|nr:choice-of-anchor D domain-containing protein [Alloacidobacterium dinghuense]QNI33470.1 choice-of-anchor D domain-containing protein [Alloacidobacterium dinghuense]